MARDLDLDNLSDGDKQYIIDRPWLMEEITLQGGDLEKLGLTPDIPADPRTIVRSPSVDSGSLVGDSARREMEEMEGESEDEYSKMLKPALIEEIERRNAEGAEIPTTGTKVELMERLRADDNSPEDDDEDDDSDEE